MSAVSKRPHSLVRRPAVRRADPARRRSHDRHAGHSSGVFLDARPARLRRDLSRGRRLGVALARHKPRRRLSVEIHRRVFRRWDRLGVFGDALALALAETLAALCRGRAGAGRRRALSGLERRPRMDHLRKTIVARSAARFYAGVPTGIRRRSGGAAQPVRRRARVRVSCRHPVERAEPARLLWLTIAPAMLYFAFHATHARVQGNWLAPLYPGLVVLAAETAASATAGWKGWAARAATPVGTARYGGRGNSRARRAVSPGRPRSNLAACRLAGAGRGRGRALPKRTMPTSCSHKAMR